LNANEIRTRFFEHCRKWGHQIIDSYPLIPIDDPTTLFISAGMQPMQPYFQGLRPPPAPRLASCQKCVRTGDLEEVGKTARHGTFFEMLGNFAPTGDYFKETAIPLAWELLTDSQHGFGLPRNRLRVTTHPDDEEAREIWRQRTDLNPNWIYENQDNWWSLASGLGPCGADSEVWWDRGLEFGCGQPDCYPDHCQRFFELWNLVFPQFDGQPDGSRRPLEAPGIDTGMGLERLAAVMQGVPSIFETDLYAPIIDFLGESAGPLPTGPSGPAPPQGERSLRVIADHLRSATFIIADGVRTSNEGRGYVLRRLIRRASLHARRLAVRSQLAGGVSVVVGVMCDQYPYLEQREPEIRTAIQAEIETFERTLERGLELFERLASRHEGTIPGEEAFKLHDTFGIPLELTWEMAQERGLEVDREGFEAAMAQQRERSRRVITHDWDRVAELPKSEFLGYTQLEAEARVAGIRRQGEDVSTAGEGDVVEVFLDQTPYYGESGGQVGDTGRITGPDGEVVVDDTKRPFDGVIAHLGRVTVGGLRVGDRVQVAVDAGRRRQIMRHHSATHVLNRALEEVLGRRGLQRGSWVGPDHATFDFPLDRPLTKDELDRLGERISEQVRAALPMHTKVLPFEEAVATGATHLFEEKYGEHVRVVCFGEWSCEFCGGTHCATTAEVGTTLISSESSIGQGLRRIDFLVGELADRLVRRRWGEMNELSRSLGVRPDQLGGRVEGLRQELKETHREVERLRDELRQAYVGGGQRANTKAREARVPLVLEQVPAVGMDDLRGWADRYLEALGGTGVVGVVNEVNFVIKVSRNLSGEYDATRLASFVGRGGGRPELAQGKLGKTALQAFQDLEEAMR
jgi:alanyl-tRNA synthetase